MWTHEKTDAITASVCDYYLRFKVLRSVRDYFFTVVVSANGTDLMREFDAVTLLAHRKPRRCHAHIRRTS